MTVQNENGRIGSFRNVNQYLRDKFGGKVMKIPIDAGFTCPNRDGTKAYGGCAFCGSRGSGDFSAGRQFGLVEQFNRGKEMMHRKWKSSHYIVYLQAFSNTYAPAARLREVYELMLDQKGVVGMAVATRPDCLPADVLGLLEDINKQTFLWVELGLQTIHERTARSMNLHYSYADFCNAVQGLNEIGVESCAHIILGLPGESREEMLDTAMAAVRAGVNGLKIHLFHLMRDSSLAAEHNRNSITFLEQDEYISIVVDILERIPPHIIIHRLTGDGPRDLLIEPKWSLNKWEVLNGIKDELERRSSWQGKLYLP